MRNIMIVLLSGLVAACAASGENRYDRVDRRAIYESHAGAAESRVRYTSIRNWWAVGFHLVVFEMDRSRHYLVELTGACDLDLGSATTLRLVSDRRNVLSEFDKVIAGGRACRVQSIRPVNYDAIKAELEHESMPENKGGVDIESDDQSSGGT